MNRISRFIPAVVLGIALALPALPTLAGQGYRPQPAQPDQPQPQAVQPAPQPQQANPNAGHRNRQPIAAPPSAASPSQRYIAPNRSYSSGGYVRPNGAAPAYTANRQYYRGTPHGNAQVVPALPRNNRAYQYNGRPYYWGGGHWYRPSGSRYIVVGPPVGLYVSTLPYYSTVWAGGSRYYYYDNTYYTYEPERRGYVVTRSPYGDDDVDSDDESGSSAVDNELYIYPMNGQSEQQQADDRYQCHRWAADQTKYDPTNSAYNESSRKEYDRAMSACLTGRGYSVK